VVAPESAGGGEQGPRAGELPFTGGVLLAQVAAACLLLAGGVALARRTRRRAGLICPDQRAILPTGPVTGGPERTPPPERQRGLTPAPTETPPSAAAPESPSLREPGTRVGELRFTGGAARGRLATTCLLLVGGVVLARRTRRRERGG
jgi:hypothetical protein